jgi:polar amino acid transport system substrate-binding protein
MLWRWRRAGIREPLVIGATIDANDIYLACSKICAPELILRLRSAIDALKRDGTAKRLETLYLGN